MIVFVSNFLFFFFQCRVIVLKGISLYANSITVEMECEGEIEEAI